VTQTEPDTAGQSADFVISRVFDAPRDLVFGMWTDPNRNHLAQWWGPNGFTTTTSAFAARPGGGPFNTANPVVTSKGDLRLTITLNPTTDQKAPPTLIQWQVKTDCPPTE